MSSDEQQVSVAGTSIDYRVTRSDDATEPRIDVGIHAITVVLPAESDIDPDADLEVDEVTVLAEEVADNVVLSDWSSCVSYKDLSLFVALDNSASYLADASVSLFPYYFDYFS